MKNIITSTLLATTILVGAVTPSFASDKSAEGFRSTMDAGCYATKNSGGINKSELTCYDKAWINYWKADDSSGVYSNIIWLRAGDEIVTVTTKEIREGGSEAIELVIVEHIVAKEVVLLEEAIEELEDMQQRLDNLEAALTAAGLEHEQIVAAMEAAKAEEIDNLKSEHAQKLIAQAEAHNDELSNVLNQVTTLNSEIETLKAELATVKENLTASEQTISNLEDQIATLETQRDEAIQDLATANSSIATLQAELIASETNFVVTEAVIVHRNADGDFVSIPIGTTLTQEQVIDILVAHGTGEKKVGFNLGAANAVQIAKDNVETISGVASFADLEYIQSNVSFNATGTDYTPAQEEVTGTAMIDESVELLYGTGVIIIEDLSNTDGDGVELYINEELVAVGASKGTVIDAYFGPGARDTQSFTLVFLNGEVPFMIADAHNASHHALITSTWNQPHLLSVTETIPAVAAADGSIKINGNTFTLSESIENLSIDDLVELVEKAYNAGYNDGYDDGYEDGYVDGYNKGFADGVNSVN